MKQLNLQITTLPKIDSACARSYCDKISTLHILRHGKLHHLRGNSYGEGFFSCLITSRADLITLAAPVIPAAERPFFGSALHPVTARERGLFVLPTQGEITGDDWVLALEILNHEPGRKLHLIAGAQPDNVPSLKEFFEQVEQALAPEKTSRITELHIIQLWPTADELTVSAS